MGWQLFPTGVGWREFRSTPSSGQFTCPNGRCKSAGQLTQYAHKSGRNWFTVLFIPLIPLNRTGEWVKCKRCKSIYPLHVLDGNSSSPSELNAPVSPAVLEEVEEQLPAIEVPRQPPANKVSTSEPEPDVPSRVEAPPVVPPQPSPKAASGGSLRFGDGDVVLDIAQMVIGRDPTAPDGFRSAVPYAVSDVTVSKTHLLVGFAGNDAWVYDNHSSNGVFVGTSAQGASRIPAGRRVMLSGGDVVSIGDSTTFTIEEPW